MIANPGRDVRLRVYGFDDSGKAREDVDRRIVDTVQEFARLRASARITELRITPAEHEAINRSSALMDSKCPALDLPLGATPEEVQAALHEVTAIRTTHGVVTLISTDPETQPDIADLTAELKRVGLERVRAESWEKGVRHYTEGGAATHNPHMFSRDQAGRAAQAGWASGFGFARGADISGRERARLRDFIQELHGMVMDAVAAPQGEVPESCRLIVDGMRLLAEQGRTEDGQEE